jgi:hypothetical protein
MPEKDTISILDGSTFVVSDTHGDVEAGPDQVQGLFYRDTRVLSRWILTVDGRGVDPTSSPSRTASTSRRSSSSIHRPARSMRIPTSR